MQDELKVELEELAYQLERMAGLIRSPYLDSKQLTIFIEVIPVIDTLLKKSREIMIRLEN